MTAENYLLLLEEYDYQTPPEVARDAAQAIQQAMVASDVFTTFVYQPGGVALGNVFTSWAALYAALDVAAPTSANGTRSPTTVLVDDSFVSPAVIPAGAYNLDEVTFRGVMNLGSGTGGAQLNLAVGVRFLLPTVGGGDLRFDGGLVVNYLDPAVACITTAVGRGVRIYLREDALLKATAGAPFVAAPQAFCIVEGVQSAQMGDGVNAVFAGAAPGVAVVRAYANSTVAANAVTGAGGLVFWDSHVPGAQGAGVTVTQVDGYAPATPGNWPVVPTTQSGALDDLASKVSRQDFNPVALAAAASPASCLDNPYTPSASAKSVSVNVTFGGSVSAPATVQAQLKRDAVLIGTTMPIVSDAAGLIGGTLSVIDTPAAGAHTYALVLTVAGGLTFTVAIGACSFAIHDN